MVNVTTGSLDRNELYETYIAAIFLILQSSGFLQPVQNMLQFYAVKLENHVMSSLAGVKFLILH